MARASNRSKVLCVDDEPQVLQGLSLQLRRGHDVHTAGSGEEGLALIEQQGPFAVVLSDMRMPGMDGSAFLAEVRRRAPDTVRMLLTGYAEINSAIAAVNDGQIFRFLTKPCPPEQLRQAFAAAAEQFRLVNAERVLLEQTLHGSIKALADILALTSPLAFGRAARIKQHVGALADALDLKPRWQVEVAAMLSQLGAVALPDEIAERYFHGQPLGPNEQAMVTKIGEVTEGLLARIPRLEEVRAILLAAGPGSSPTPAKQPSDEQALRASVLRVAVDFDDLDCQGMSTQLALDTLGGREDRYDPAVLQAFVALKGAGVGQEVKEISVGALRVGMVFAEDVLTTKGVLLVTRGYEVQPSFLARVRNFPDGSVREPLRVLAQTK